MASVERSIDWFRDAGRPHRDDRALLASVLEGLRQHPKRISPVWFYDERGSCLFDEICELPEYYVTRTELAILQRHLPEMAARIRSHACVIEPGSGTGLKTKLLLEALDRPSAYVPVDVACEHLEAAAARLRSEHPHICVHPVCADFTMPFEVPDTERFARRAIFFPGSTIGNFDRHEAVRLLARLRHLAPGGGMLIGFDMVKPAGVLVPAYDDAAGVTAAFNLNALEHLNRRLGTDFDPAGFRHRAVWNPVASRIEMHLVSTRAQMVRIAGRDIHFAAGETIHTENSYKYTTERFASLAEVAGWKICRCWTDARGFYSLQLLE